MRYSIIAIIFVFLFSSVSFAANKLKVGESYSGSLHNLYLYGNTFLLPPGSWRVSDVERDGEWQWVGFNNNNGSYAGAWLSLQKAQGIRWVGTTKDCKEQHEQGASILAEADTKSAGGTNTGTIGGHAYWCVMKSTNDIIFSVHILGDTAIHSYYYFPKKIISINKNSAEKYGERVFAESMKAYKGNKSANLNFLSEIIGKKTNTSSSTTKKDYSSLSDKSICSKSTLKDGSAWVKIDDYVREAWSISLSMDDCNALTGRKPLSEVNKVEETSSDSSSIKSKLQGLKSMLDEGLISQEQYDVKSSKILEEY